jgi:hypothetical protein
MYSVYGHLAYISYGPVFARNGNNICATDQTHSIAV